MCKFPQVPKPLPGGWYQKTLQRTAVLKLMGTTSRETHNVPPEPLRGPPPTGGACSAAARGEAHRGPGTRETALGSLAHELNISN